MSDEPLVQVDPKRCSGQPVLRNTRFPVAQLIAELAETNAVEDLADNFDLDVKLIRDCLLSKELATALEIGYNSILTGHNES